MYRKSELSDCRAIYNLICDMERKQLPYDVFERVYLRQLSDVEHFYCLICEIDGKVAGMLNLRFEEQLHHAGWIAEIMEFVVDPSCASSRMAVSTQPMAMGPQPAAANVQPLALAAQQPVSFTATVIMPNTPGADGAAAWAAPQVILKVGEAIAGEVPTTVAEAGMRSAEPVAHHARSFAEAPENVHSDSVQVHDGDALSYDELELQRAEDELRAAEGELNAMRANAHQVEAGFLRAQAEIKLAEAELLRARAEILEKKRAAAQVADRSSWVGSESGNSSEPKSIQPMSEAESAE